MDPLAGIKQADPWQEFFLMNHRILFINPRIADKSIVFAVESLNPVSLCLPYMAVMSLEEGFEVVQIVDENYDREDYGRKAELSDIIVITSEFFGAARVRELSTLFRNMGKTIIIDGLYPTFAPEDAGQYGDSIIIGEVEHTWRTVLRDIKAGRLKDVYHVDGLMDLADLPIYPRDILPPHESLFPVEATRGCRFRCDFCLETRLYNYTVRTRPIEDVVRQIEVSGSRNIHFMNCDIVADPSYAKELFKALIPLKILWGSQSTITIVEDDELLKLAAESGCFLLFFGFESINSSSIREANKTWSKPLRYGKAIKRVHEAGIGIIGSFIFGFDSDDKDVFQRTLNFVNENELEIAHFVPLGPIAGTVFQDKFIKQERMSCLDEGKFDHFHASFTPKQMTEEELEAGLKHCWTTCYSKQGIKKRLGPYLKDKKKINEQIKQGALSREAIIVALNLDYKYCVNEHYR